MCYQHQDEPLENEALLRKARCACAEPTDHQVSVSLLQDPKEQHRPSFLQLSKLLWGTSLHLPSPGSSRTAEPLISYHPSRWPVATLGVSWWCQIPQLLCLLCQHQPLLQPGYTNQAENVPAVKSDPFRAIWHLISYICHKDT